MLGRAVCALAGHRWYHRGWDGGERERRYCRRCAAAQRWVPGRWDSGGWGEDRGNG